MDLKKNLSMTGGDFRQFLQAELFRRTQSNPRYSLRAFAKSLGIGVSFLSMILSSKRQISRTTLVKLCQQLALSPAETDHFLRFYSSERKRHKLSFNEDLSPYTRVDEDRFQVIADWYHFAILELLHLKGFKSQPRWIAKTLGISLVEAKQAIDRLIRIQMLSRDSRGTLKNISGSQTVVNNVSVSAARSRLQEQILKKALVALKETPLQWRDQSSMTMAVDSKKLAAAKEMTAKFRRELTDFLESGSSKDAVYHLSISLYPVTQFPPK